MPLILEGMLTTLNVDGTTNVAAQGPIVVEPDREFVFRPYPGSVSRDNLLRELNGVFQTIDDVLLLARVVVAGIENGPRNTAPELIPSEKLAVPTLAAACRAWEFEIVEIRTTTERAELAARVLHARTVRPSSGWNRAQFAVIETAIMTTRLFLLEESDVRRDLTRWRTIVEKTAGRNELQAFELLAETIELHYRESRKVE